MLHEQVFDSLAGQADLVAPPSGTYDGVAWRPGWPIVRRVTGRVWHGKVFNGGTVWNRLGPHKSWHLHGSVWREDGDIILKYGAGLRDVLRPLGDGVWLGKAYVLGRFMTYFVLMPAT